MQLLLFAGIHGYGFPVGMGYLCRRKYDPIASGVKLKYIIYFLISTCSFRVIGQVKLTGMVMRCDSTRFPVDQALIVDRNINIGVISGADGTYSITVDSMSILVVRKIGFKPDTIYVKKLFSKLSSGRINYNICLESRPVVLPVFKFNYKKPNIDPVERRKEWSYVLDRQKASAQSPITALWQMYSKKGRELRKIDELYAAEERRRYVEQRFSRFKGVIMTGLTGKDLDAFLLSCRPSYETMQILSDYELFERISHCFEEYKALHPEILKNIRIFRSIPPEENGNPTGN